MDQSLISPLELPLSSVVGFGGSRYGSPFGVARVLRGVLGAGGSVRVGCARGVDLVVRENTPLDRVTVLKASDLKHLPFKAALAVRTKNMVSGSSCLLAFPSSSGVLGKGTGLAVKTALDLGLPVWVAGPVKPTGKKLATPYTIWCKRSHFKKHLAGRAFLNPR